MDRLQYTNLGISVDWYTIVVKSFKLYVTKDIIN